MKKIAVCFIALLSLLSAQNIMRIDSLQMAINDTAALGLHIENNDPFVGFQYDLTLPHALTLYDAVLTERAVNHVLTLVDQSDNCYQMIVYSLTNTPFNGSSGKVMELLLIAESDPGTYDVEIDSVIIGNASAENILTGSENGYIEIIDTLSTKINQGNLLPSEYEIPINNYPNPFNPITTIQYDIPERLDVKMVIYDVSGKKIKTLVNTSQDAMTYKIIWNGLDNFGHQIASGIYICRIVAISTESTFISHQKLLYIK